MQQVDRPYGHRRDQRGGAVLGLVGICMIAFMAFAMLGVDIGRLAFTGTEAQALADAAATSGAAAYLTDPVGSVSAQAQAVADLNTIDGTPATQGNTTTALTVTPGCWSNQTDSFTAAQSYPPACGEDEVQAVRATADATVQNVVAAMFQHATSTVSRSAIAVAGGLGNGRPAFPAAISECWFKTYLNDRDCAQLDDNFVQTPAVGNSCWTSLTSGDPTNPNTLERYLPPECSFGGHVGGGQDPPLVNIGDSISLGNGQDTSFLKLIEDCVNKGYTDWLIPVVKCTSCTGTTCGSIQCNQTDEVVGFAAVKVTQVSTQGNPKFITIQTLCRDNLEGEGGGGGTEFGVKKVSMAQ